MAYLAAHKDLFNGERVGYALGSRITRSLVMTSLLVAMKRKRPEPGLINYSDRGNQYCSSVSSSGVSRHGGRGTIWRGNQLPYWPSRFALIADAIALLVLLFLRVPIGLVRVNIGWVGAWMLTGNFGSTFTSTAYYSIADFSLVTILCAVGYGTEKPMPKIRLSAEDILLRGKCFR